MWLFWAFESGFRTSERSPSATGYWISLPSCPPRCCRPRAVNCLCTGVVIGGAESYQKEQEPMTRTIDARAARKRLKLLRPAFQELLEIPHVLRQGTPRLWSDQEGDEELSDAAAFELERDRDQRARAAGEWLHDSSGGSRDWTTFGLDRPRPWSRQLGDLLDAGQLSWSGLSYDAGLRARGDGTIALGMDRDDALLPFGEMGEVDGVGEPLVRSTGYLDAFPDCGHIASLSACLDGPPPLFRRGQPEPPREHGGDPLSLPRHRG